jgi:autotransporter-associated beta strand protein
MKPKGLAKTLLGTSALTAAIVVSFLAPSASAVSDTWSGTTDATWATSTNWLGGNVPGTGDTATFNNAGNGNTTIDLGAGVTLGVLLFDTPSAAAYTIGSGGAGSQTLTLSTVGNAITMNSTVANNELINANLALAVTSTAGTPSTYYSVTNNSTTNTLTLAGGISASTAGNKVLAVNGSGNTNISGAITAGSGAVNLVKLGTGTLTLSGGGAIGGNFITAYGGNNGAVLLGGTTKISSGAYTSAGEFVIGGVLAAGGAGVNTNLTMDGGSLVVSNWLSIGRGNGIGAVSSDLVLNNAATITADNFSAGFNNTAANLPKGTITLNGTSSLSVTTNFNFAESAGSNFTMDINDSATVNHTSATPTRVGMANGAVGVINVNGGTFYSEGDLNLGTGGTGSGKLVLNSGTVNVASGTERWLKINDSASASTGQIDVNGGNLNLNTNTDLRFSTNGSASGTNVVNLNGGNISGLTGNNNGVFSGGSQLDLNYASTQAGVNNTFNLNGGTLTIGQIITTNNAGTAAFNFNGGTLRAAATTADFINLGGANQRVNVRNGGAVIDTNNVSVTVAEALLHSNIGGDNAIDGGLTKNGGGTLTVTNAANTYTGNTLVNNGTLATAATGNLGLGNVTVANSLTANLILGNSNSIADTATLFFGANSFVSLSDGINETVFAAIQTDDSQSIGAGTYTGAQLNTFFGVATFNESTTGTLTVVPEPSAALLGGLGVLGLLRRRRKA